jgi:hypothetical protein
MILRLVKLTFEEEFAEKFEKDFANRKSFIESCEGCHEVKLLKKIKKSEDQTAIYFTQSIWDSEIDLNKYRNTNVFSETWNEIKPWFKERAEAWSTQIVE